MLTITQDRMNSGEIIARAAFDMIVSQGLAELTLRPLADKVGLSLTALTQAMGSKEQLIARLIESAMAQDAAFRAGWLAQMQAMAPILPTMRAVLAETILDDWVGHHRHLVCLLLDLVQEAGRQAGGGTGPTAPALNRWLDEAGPFWAQVLFDDARQADVAMGYILDEGGFSLFGRDHAAYRMIRSLCLHRLTGGLYPDPDQAVGTARHLEHWIARLAPERTYPDAPDTSKRGMIAAEAGRLVVTQGIEAVTHRAVAAAAGTPASTVVYHFGSRDDLVVAALHAIVTNFRQRLTGTADQAYLVHASYEPSRDLVRATSVIAIAAARYPGLAPHALDMRRRRGENIDQRLLETFGLRADRPGDRTTSQVVSVALFGMRMVAMARGQEEGAVVHAAFARLVEHVG
jgi:AcrR family transcriptional regulator